MTDLRTKKIVRWTILFAVLLAGFASPFSPTSCSYGFAVGFPLPHYFIMPPEATFVWPLSMWLSLVVDVLAIFFLTSVFWRLQGRLINHASLLTGLRLSVAYGILSSAICFLFYYLDHSEFWIIWPAYVFYAPLFWLEEVFRPENLSSAQIIIYARVLLLPILALWMFVFAGITIAVKKVFGYFYCPSSQKQPMPTPSQAPAKPKSKKSGLLLLAVAIVLIAILPSFLHLHQIFSQASSAVFSASVAAVQSSIVFETSTDSVNVYVN